MTMFISKILLLLLCLGTVNCSKITFSAIKGDDLGGSEPATETPPVVIVLPPVQKKLDILIVMDNSSSMLPEHSMIEYKLRGFTNKLKAKGIDYRIAVTTTDARKEVKAEILKSKEQTPRGFGGKAISFDGFNFISSATPNGESLILSSLDRSLEASCGTADIDNEQYWQEDAVGPEVCSTDYEEPIKVIKQFLEQKDTVNAGFLQSNTPLVALIITDEDIESFEDKNMNMAQELAAVRALKTNFTAYGIIAQERDIEKCQANWSGNTSRKVQKFIHLSGGAHQSICDNDYTSIFNKIANDFDR